jgi:outer membrane pore protein F
MRMTQPIKLLAMSLALAPSVQADVAGDLDRIEKEIEKIRQATNSPKASASKLNLYGTFRPIMRVADDGTDNSTNLEDGLSRIGFAGSTPVMGSGKAFFRGEWNINIKAGGEFNGARKAYAGIEGAFGRVAIGKQRPPQYNLIAEHVDIFNHADSPYAYDGASDAGAPFFVDNMTSYQYKTEMLNVQAAFRSDGASGKDNEDLVNAGIGLTLDNMYVAAAYLQSTAPDGIDPNKEGTETKNMALATHMTFDKLYLAAAYQAITQTPKVGKDVDSTTIDISAAYALPKRYKVKAGVFAFDDGVSGAASTRNQGANITVERQLADNVRVHVEYLTKDFDKADAVSALSFGIRYDFNADL